MNCDSCDSPHTLHAPRKVKSSANFTGVKMGSKSVRSFASLAVFAFLTCFSWAANVTLEWTPNSESDVASYRVYRSETNGSGYSRIDGGGLSVVKFIDSTVLSGHTYYYVVTAMNSSGLESGRSSQVQATIPQVVVNNNPPTANAGPDEIVSSGKTVTVTGTGSDPDGDPLSFSWTQSYGPAVTIVNANSASMSFVAPIVTVDTSLRFLLTVSDGRGGKGSNEVGIRVLAVPNRAPVATCSADQTVSRGQTAYLRGSGTDPDGDTLRFAWTQRSGPSVTLKNASTATASFIAPKVTTTTTLIFRLTVTDPGGLFGTDDMRVFVTKNASMTVVAPSSVEGVDPVFQDTFVSLGLVNFGTLAADVAISAVDSTGTDNALRTTTLGPQYQDAFMTDTLGLLPNGVSLLADSDGSVNGFAILADSALRRMDGIGTQATPASVLYLPGAGLHAADKTMLTISNTDSSTAAELTVTLISQEGAILAQANSSLSAGGVKQDTLKNFMGVVPSTPRPFYVRVAASHPIQAFGLQADTESFATLPAQPADPASRLWVPHYYVGTNGEQTELALVNASPMITTVRIKAFGSTGELASRDMQISADGALVATLTDLFPQQALLQGALAASGHLTIEVMSPDPLTGQIPRLAGSLRVSAGPKVRYSVPVVSEGRRNLAYLHIAQSRASNVFTGLGLQNTTLSPASVRLEAFNRQGALTAQREIVVPAGSRIVEILNSPAVFGLAFEQTGGHLRITSSQPLAGCALFGDYSGEYLAVIEPQATQ